MERLLVVFFSSMSRMVCAMHTLRKQKKKLYMKLNSGLEKQWASNRTKKRKLQRISVAIHCYACRIWRKKKIYLAIALALVNFFVYKTKLHGQFFELISNAYHFIASNFTPDHFDYDTFNDSKQYNFSHNHIRSTLTLQPLNEVNKTKQKLCSYHPRSIQVSNVAAVSWTTGLSHVYSRYCYL